MESLAVFMSVLGQVAFIFYEDIVESFKKQLQLSALLHCFQIPLKKNRITISRVFVHTHLAYAKNAHLFFMPQRLWRIDKV